MKLRIKHTLRYSLGSPPRAVQHLLLTALSTPQQKVETWSIAGPGLETASTFRDGYGNRAHLVTLQRPEALIEIVVTGQVETFDKAGVLGRLDYDPSPALFRRTTATATPDPVLIEGLTTDSGRVAFLHSLMDRLHEPVRASSQSQSQNGQDQSQSDAPDGPDPVSTFIAVARSLDIPARYVKGYFFEDGAARPHSWAEAWDEGLGWIGFDPSLNFCPAAGHIRIASGLDASTMPPIRSVPHIVEGIEQTLTIEVDQEPST